MDIKEKYRPYNFSSTKCYIITLKFKVPGLGLPGIFGIEEKLPLDIGILKGVYITVNSNSLFKIVGGVSLNFNESELKSWAIPLYNTKLLKETSHPVPLNEEIKSNSIMQGFYVIRNSGGDAGIKGNIKIYLHYEPRK